MFKFAVHRITFSKANAQTWLRAFQQVFPSCSGEFTAHDLAHLPPADIASRLPDDGKLSVTYTPEGVSYVSLVSATSGREFGVPTKYGSCQITFPGGSREAAACVVAAAGNDYGVGTMFWGIDPEDADEWAGTTPIGRAAPPPLAA